MMKILSFGPQRRFSLVFIMLVSYYHNSVILLFFIENLCLRHCNPITPMSSSLENEPTTTTTTTYCPDGEDWCDNPDHYPEDGILEALTRGDSQLLDLLDDHTIVKRGANMENRSLDSFQDLSNICHSSFETHYIRAARNIQQEFQFIINIPGPGAEAGAHRSFTQTIPMTICSSPGLSCGHGDLVEVETLCQQEHREIKLLVFTRDRRLSLDTFVFKSCCVCYIKTRIPLK